MLAMVSSSQSLGLPLLLEERATRVDWSISPALSSEVVQVVFVPGLADSLKNEELR
jgi:hypothetical protein